MKLHVGIKVPGGRLGSPVGSKDRVQNVKGDKLCGSERCRFRETVIEAVTFEVFGLADGGMIIVREIAETTPEDGKLQAVLGQAQKNGDRAIFDDFLAAGKRLGLHARPYKVSVMCTAPTNKTRMLFTIWTRPGGTPMWTSSETFEEFFPGISADQARRHLGPDGRRTLDQHSAAQFLSGLENLFAEAQSEAPGSSGSD